MPFPSPEDASGIWSLRDVRKHRETGAWPDTKLEVQYVVVGGGGGGGVIGGGGGGGGVRMNFHNKPVTATWPYGEQREPRMFLAPGTYPVIVGGGGNSGQQYTPATNGGDSSFNGIVAFGGGGGGNHVTGTYGQSNRGKDGGCGGGGSDNNTVGGRSLHRKNPGYQAAPAITVNDTSYLLSYATRAVFPATGSTFRYYRALDTQKLYLWNGTTYLETAPIYFASSPTASTGFHGNEGAKGAYLYPTTERYGGGGGGAFTSPNVNVNGGAQKGGLPATWCYSDESYPISVIELGGGGGGGGYVSTTGGTAQGGGGGSVNSGTAGTARWMNNQGVLSTSTTGAGQVGNNLIGGFGQPNRGGGGGGCSWQNPTITTHGGSGVVIIRYHGLQQATGGEIQTSTGLFRTGWTTHVFNSSGSFTVNSTSTGGLYISRTPQSLYARGN